MNAQDLLNYLLQIQSQGVDLNTLTIVTEYCVCDPTIPYDSGEICQSYPDQFRMEGDNLILTPMTTI